MSLLNWKRAAVLSLDIQTALVSIYVKSPDSFLSTVGFVLEKGRRMGAGVMHVRVGFRPGYPEISERNRLFALIKSDPQRRQVFGRTDRRDWLRNSRTNFKA